MKLASLGMSNINNASFLYDLIKWCMGVSVFFKSSVVTVACFLQDLFGVVDFVSDVCVLVKMFA